MECKIKKWNIWIINIIFNVYARRILCQLKKQNDVHNWIEMLCIDEWKFYAQMNNKGLMYDVLRWFMLYTQSHIHI